jgi:putative endonuclease
MRLPLFMSILRFDWFGCETNGRIGGLSVRWGQQASGGAAIPPKVAAFVYLLRCSDGTLYCGWSTDPERRLRQHRAGRASRYTRTRLPVELVYTRELASRSDAMREEARIKRLSPADKRRLAGAARVANV